MVDVESSIVVCRALLESQMRNYVSEHIRYVNNTKTAKCNYVMNSKTSVSDALDHMHTCPGQLESWRLFKTNSKLYTSAPGRTVYAALSESVHNATVKENQVHVPEQIEPYPKRFLLRLFLALGYVVKVVDRNGNLREPVRDELETPNPTPGKPTNKKRGRSASISSESSSSSSNKKAKKSSKKEEKKKKNKNKKKSD